MGISLAALTSALRNNAGALGGGISGGIVGGTVAPELMGYEDNPHAKFLSVITNAATGAMLGKHLQRGSLMEGHNLDKMVGAGVALEAAPMVKDMMDKQVAATEAATEAADNTLVSQQLDKMWERPTARGAVAGAGVGGLAGLITGLMRARSDAELSGNDSRVGMALKDMGRGAAGGGLIGGIAGHTFANKRAAMIKEVPTSGTVLNRGSLMKMLTERLPDSYPIQP